MAYARDTRRFMRFDENGDPIPGSETSNPGITDENGEFVANPWYVPPGSALSQNYSTDNERGTPAYTGMGQLSQLAGLTPGAVLTPDQLRNHVATLISMSEISGQPLTIDQLTAPTNAYSGLRMENGQVVFRPETATQQLTPTRVGSGGFLSGLASFLTSPGVAIPLAALGAGLAGVGAGAGATTGVAAPAIEAGSGLVNLANSASALAPTVGGGSIGTLGGAAIGGEGLAGLAGAAQGLGSVGLADLAGLSAAGLGGGSSLSNITNLLQSVPTNIPGSAATPGAATTTGGALNVGSPAIGGNGLSGIASTATQLGSPGSATVGGALGGLTLDQAGSIVPATADLANSAGGGAAAAGAANTGVAGSLLSRLLGGSASTADWMELAGKLGAGALGAFQANQQTGAFERLADKYLGLGAPARARLESSYTDPNSFLTGPDVTSITQRGSDAAARSLSTQFGNPAMSPEALARLNELNTTNQWNQLSNYRNQLAAQGGLGVAPAAQFGGQAATNSGGIYSVGGSLLGDLTSTKQPTLLDQLTRLAAQTRNTGGTNTVSLP